MMLIEGILVSVLPEPVGDKEIYCKEFGYVTVWAG